MSDDEDEQQGSGSQGEQGDPETAGDDESEDSGSSDDSSLDRPNDIVTDVREGDEDAEEH